MLTISSFSSRHDRIRHPAWFFFLLFLLNETSGIASLLAVQGVGGWLAHKALVEMIGEDVF